MQAALKTILAIQELDMKMIRLMRVKNDRKRENEQMQHAQKELCENTARQEANLLQIKKNMRILETQVNEVSARIEQLEKKQNSLKKVEEFAAIGQEITAANREKAHLEQQLSDLTDQSIFEEEQVKQKKSSLVEVQAQHAQTAEEIHSSIISINEEGQVLLNERQELAKEADAELLAIYERLLQNKKDRVIVPIENRTCSGCHILLTAQHENLVRRGERPVFCEHCSRMNYWQDADSDLTVAGPKKRKRRSPSAA